MEKFLGLFDLESMEEEELRTMSPLVFAYIGDALYEIYIRKYIVHKYKVKVNELHKISTRFVKASAQAKIIHAIEEELTEEEWKIVKRGRNQKSGSVAKNASIIDYKYATGFECLLGYLYLLRKTRRIQEIIYMAINIIEKDK
ncbi:Mini-ribonuclease 3 [Paramaledivibacter caminithermalis]|jgi:ribonuclease-3 family protein|uniref:Mini-ribonuclease 3 n=1 Tax=Paramaledivibacter caminithermalis (strain DSM 15212 / CIP 107654 / DViRD3) TaxID=1121301 RepID=A0A1M6SCH1_PARC5|nr:ribonuclease III domain-containing protein [Paramaledivibacter caminithermalis]SHK42430.1 ribonuclease-3 family protein [Paramaledivibacter caminithermalis DSM 15212]